MKRKFGLFLVFGAVLPLAAASAAWACGVLATATVTPKVAAPGQAITVTGKNYASFTGANPVTIALKSRDGDVLATTQAGSDGKINQTTFLPQDLSPGWYVVVATQSNANGTPKSGTPGRTSLRVQGASNSAEAAPAPWSSSTPSGPAGSGGSTLLMLLAAGVSLSMLGLGWTLVGRKTRALPGTRLSV